MNETNQMILNIGFDAGDNWQERLADALLAIQAPSVSDA